MGRFLNQLHVIEERSDQLSISATEHSNEAVANASKVDTQTMEYIREVYHTSGKVLYYISSSNWNSFYAKIKNAVNALAAANESSELNPPEIRILSFASLTIPKLHSILTGKALRLMNVTCINHFNRIQPVFFKYENSRQVIIRKDAENCHLEMDRDETFSVC